MKKTIGWILLIVGLLALLGGLTSTVETDPMVNVFVYGLKFLMIFGGGYMAFSEKTTEEKENEIENSNSNDTVEKRKVQNPYEGNKFEVEYKESFYEDKKKKKYPFLAKEIEGYYQLSDELIKMNTIGCFKELAASIETNPQLNRQKFNQTKQFFISDNISMLKMFFNQEYDSKSYDPTSDKFVSPSLKFFVDTPGSKSYVYPSWFYWAYPDVAKWLIKGEGNKIAMNEFKEELNYLAKFTDYQLLQEFMTSEFYGDHESENEDLKIKPEHLRKLIDLYKRYHPNLALECEVEPNN